MPGYRHSGHRRQFLIAPFPLDFRFNCWQIDLLNLDNNYRNDILRDE